MLLSKEEFHDVAYDLADVGRQGSAVAMHLVDHQSEQVRHPIQDSILLPLEQPRLHLVPPDDLLLFFICEPHMLLGLLSQLASGLLLELGLLLLLPVVEILQVPESHEEQHINDLVLNQLVSKWTVGLDLEVGLLSLPCSFLKSVRHEPSTLLLGSEHVHDILDRQC